MSPAIPVNRTSRKCFWCACWFLALAAILAAAGWYQYFEVARLAKEGREAVATVVSSNATNQERPRGRKRDRFYRTEIDVEGYPNDDRTAF